MTKKTNDELELLHKKLWELYKQLRSEKQEKWNRTLPFSELLFDRWEKAKFLKAKNGTSIYDSSYVFGNVSIGKNSWKDQIQFWMEVEENSPLEIFVV